MISHNFKKIIFVASSLRYSICPGLIQNHPSDKVWRTSTLFASPLNWFLRNIALPITNKRLPGPASERGGYQRPSDRHQWLYRKLKISLAEKYLDSTEKRLHGKIFRIQKFLDSKVPSLDCGFKISGDMTKPGCFFISDSSSRV